MLKIKLAAFASLIIILFSTVMVFLVLRVSRDDNIEKASRNVSLSVELLADKSNVIFDDIRKGAVLFSFNEDAYILVNRNASQYNYEKIRSLKDSVTTVTSYIGLNNFVSSIYMLDTRNMEAVSFNYGMTQMLPIFSGMKPEEIGKIRQRWIGTMELESLPQRNKNRESIFFYRVYSKNGENYGAIVLTVSEAKIAELYKDITAIQGSTVYLMDDDGVIISTPDKSLIGTNIHAKLGNGIDLSGESRSGFQIIDGQRELVAVSRIPVNGWRYVLAVPERELMTEASSTVTLTAVLIGCIAVLTAISIAWFFTRFFAAPLERLMADVNAYNDPGRRGQRDAHSYKRKDEIGYLASNIFNTLHENDELNKRLYQQRLMLMEADIRILYAQINPHFLYNALNAITWLAEFNENTKVITMLEKLSAYYRANLGSGHETTKLEDEKAMLESYIDIQKLRYAERLFCSIDFQPDTLECVIARHLLQPIVENAIIHCVERSSDPINISIVSRRVDGRLKLSVSDDGTGINEEKMAEIEDVMHADENRTGRYSAFRNIYRRILLLYGDGYGIDIDTEPGRGTTVTLRLPIIEERKETNG